VRLVEEGVTARVHRGGPLVRQHARGQPCGILTEDLGDNAAAADYLPRLQSAAHRALGVVERLGASGAR
jgi:hypothetical protein